MSTLFPNLQMVQTGIDQFFLFRPDDPETSYASLGAQQVALLEGLWQRARPGVVGVYSYAYGYDGAPGSVAVIGSPVFSLNLDGRQAGVLGAVAVAIDSRVIELQPSGILPSGGPALFAGGRRPGQRPSSASRWRFLRRI